MRKDIRATQPAGQATQPAGPQADGKRRLAAVASSSLIDTQTSA